MSDINSESVEASVEANEKNEIGISLASTKLCSMLSLCKRAGKLVSGESNCENAIKGRKAKIIFLSYEASKNTRKKFINSSIYYKVPIYTLDLTKEKMGSMIGERQRSVITIIGGDFTKQITKLINMT